jgi:hypothetical protein
MFTDAPNSIRSTYKGKKFDYSFFDLDLRNQAFLAIPFASLLYISIVDKTFLGTPIAKFNEYLRLITTELDVLSTKEIEIAKFCFANPPAAARNTINSRKKIRNNFLKTKVGKLPTTYPEALSVAFNGACDLNLLNSANVADYRGVDGVTQDCWVATRDKKLHEFSRISHHVNLDGEPGKYAALTLSSEQVLDNYWNEALQQQQRLSLDRANYHASRQLDIPSLVQKAYSAAEAAKTAFI